MTDEFIEMTEQLARGLNFKGGSVILIATTPEEEEVHVHIKGNIKDMTLGLCCVLRNMLEPVDDFEALFVRDAIKDELIADESRRFQEKEMGKV